MAPGVVELALQTVPQAFHRRELKAVVVTVLAGGELSDRSESCIGGAESQIGRRLVGKWRKTALAYGLVAIDLGRGGLGHGARADVARLQAGGGSELMFHLQAPLHEVRRVKFAIWDGRDRDRRKTTRRIRLWRCAGELALGKSRGKSLIGGDGCADGAVQHFRRD